MKILVIGGYGREHAITLALSRNPLTELYCIMSKHNPGISKLCNEVLIHSETDVDAVISFAKTHNIEYAIIGSEVPLAYGISDALVEVGIKCVGPSKSAARIETDKGFCRYIMEKYGIEGNPNYKIVSTPEEGIAYIRSYNGDLAIKPTGLTGGKGVKVMGEQITQSDAIEYVLSLKNQKILLEERLFGEEFTLMCFVDGKTLVAMPLIQDHKRAYNGDKGPNTGGMGAYTLSDHKLPFVTDKDYSIAMNIMQKTVSALDQEGCPYKGILYGQFMNTSNGPKLIEFNARFGDPEAMNVLTILESDFTTIIEHIVSGTLSSSDVSFKNMATVCKYIVPKDYPDNPHPNDTVFVGPHDNTTMYYANTIEIDENTYQTQKSRMIAFVGVGNTLSEAEHVVELACKNVNGNIRYRSDIGTESLLNKRIEHMRELRK